MQLATVYANDLQSGQDTVLSYIQKEMHRLHTETTRSSDYLLQTSTRATARDAYQQHFFAMARTQVRDFSAASK